MRVAHRRTLERFHDRRIEINATRAVSEFVAGSEFTGAEGIGSADSCSAGTVSTV
ncbi:MAG: hypothetical protein JSR95_14615 [Proteobacteria bacterium]|nr:hypothetical protein [Pseudomonadota bacterium]